MPQLRLAPGTNSETLLDVSRLLSADYAKTHTGKSDFDARGEFDSSLFNHALDEIYLEKDDGSLLFRGRLETIALDNAGIETRLSGPSIAYKLENAEIQYTVTNQLGHNAIDDFWTNETSFSPTVTTPSINNSTTGTSVQEANTNSEFDNIAGLSDSDPLAAQNSNLELLQSCFTQEGENKDRSRDTTSFQNSSEFSDEFGEGFNGNARSDAFMEWDFTVDYTIPSDKVGLQVRDGDFGKSNGSVAISWYINNNRVDNLDAGTGLVFGWTDVGSGTYNGNGYTGPDLQPGTHTIRLEFDGSSTNDNTEAYQVDVIAPHDTRFSYNFDSSTDSNNALSGPELFPDSFEKAFNKGETSWNITDGTLSTTWDDTTNNQRIQLRLGDQTWFPNNGDEDNTSSVTTDFGSEVGNQIQGRARFSRYGSQTSTPTSGINGQKLQDWEITIDGNDRPVITDETFEGSKLDVAQKLHERASMRFTFEHKKNSLPVESYRPQDKTKTLPSFDEVNRIRKKDFEGYANQVTVRGQRDDSGTRQTETVSDTTEINDLGDTIHFDTINPSLDTQPALKNTARQILADKVNEREDKGVLEIAPKDVQPGFGRDNPFNDDANSIIPIEEVRYQVRRGELIGRVVFDFRTELRLGEDIGSLNNQSRNTKLGF